MLILPHSLSEESLQFHCEVLAISVAGYLMIIKAHWTQLDYPAPHSGLKCFQLSTMRDCKVLLQIVVSCRIRVDPAVWMHETAMA